MKALRTVLLLAVLVVGAGFGYIYFSGGSGEPSTDLTTPALNTTTAAASGDPTAAFVIVSEESVASFQLGSHGSERHRGWNHLGGRWAGPLRPGRSGLAQFSEILINARTLETNRSNRDRAMRSSVVLDSGSDEHEFISFMPATVTGLDGAITLGEEVAFEIIGDLTIKGATQTVTFSVTALLEAEDRLSGRAQAEVLRADFGIGIPNAPGVAGVTDEVTISLDFVAVKA